MKHLLLMVFIWINLTSLSIAKPTHIEPHIEPKIITGQDVNLTLPWMAGIFISQSNVSCSHDDDCFEDFTFSCAGALIHPQWIVTAAHCVHINAQDLKPGAVNLFMGEVALDDVVDFLEIEQIIVHEQYGLVEDYKSDIALIKLVEPVSYTPIEVINEGKESLITTGASLLLAGWGRSIRDGFYYYPDQLQMTQLEFIPMFVCQEIFSGLTLLDDNQLCAGGDGVHDACDGDSGGPLIANIAGRWKIVGLVSFGVQVCALTGYPSVFTRLSQYELWFDEKGVPPNETTLGSTQIAWLFLIVVCFRIRQLKLSKTLN